MGSRDHVSIYTVNGVPLFFQHFDGPYFLSLRLLHKCQVFYSLLSCAKLKKTLSDPSLLPHLQVDRGAIKYLLAGANMMCPGFTSAGGQLPSPESALPAGTTVAIHCEGKEHAAGIGVTKLGTEAIKKANKGIGVEMMTYLGDDLWVNERL